MVWPSPLETDHKYKGMGAGKYTTFPTLLWHVAVSVQQQENEYDLFSFDTWTIATFWAYVGQKIDEFLEGPQLRLFQRLQYEVPIGAEQNHDDL